MVNKTLEAAREYRRRVNDSPSATWLRHYDNLLAECNQLRNALSDLMECHDEDVGKDYCRDEESVGWEGNTFEGGKPMKLTFGVLRRARKTLEGDSNEANNNSYGN